MTPESELAPVRRQAIDAVKVMFDRAVEHYPKSLEIADNKEDVENTTLSSGGPLQDCEFGMILLLVREWLGDGFLDDSGIPSEKFDWVITSLVESTISRLLKPNLKNEGGGGGKRTAFFTGEPYTQHSRGKKYSANLDAAMIVLSFLALAVKHLDEPLSQASHSLQLRDVELPGWVKSQRDVALHIIIEGLRYATECRVVPGDKFIGFTCDPESKRERPTDGCLEEDVDRLFFTWTACETINDMIGWREDYLAPRSAALPPLAVSELNHLIGDLQTTLHQAADWCANVFLEKFKNLELPDPTDLVAKIDELGVDGVPSVDQQYSIDQLKTIVQNVYHLSQYAAIRSLVPQKIELHEVKTISDKLDVLVKQSIIGSKLDEARNPKLFSTLTREYNLGKSNLDPYVDDAWYPLVMRSLSGLLARTLDDFGSRFSRREVFELTVSFRRSLQEHFRNMIKRRPVGGSVGVDGKLWSFVSGQPYVLYATQRTIFALMKYEEFLTAVEDFQKEEPDAEKKEAELAMIFARQFSEFFKPAIRELLAQATPPPVVAAILPPTDPLDIPLPEEPWAAEVIRRWLGSVTEDFKESQIANTVDTMASRLRLVEINAKGYIPSEELNQPKNERKRNGALEQWDVLNKEYEKIRESGELGKRLSDLENWEASELKLILFDHLIRNYLRRFRTIEKLLKDEPTEEWKLIQEAIQTQENISKLDPTGSLL
jgi:hypothetical protein